MTVSSQSLQSQSSTTDTEEHEISTYAIVLPTFDDLSFVGSDNPRFRESDVEIGSLTQSVDLVLMRVIS